MDYIEVPAAELAAVWARGVGEAFEIEEEQFDSLAEYYAEYVLVVRRLLDDTLWGVPFKYGTGKYQDNLLPWEESSTVELRPMRAVQTVEYVFQ